MAVPWQGTFTQNSIAELIQAICLDSSAGRLTFRAGTQMASLYLLEGRLVDAHYKSLTGLEALGVLLGFENGEYRFVSGLRSDTPHLNGELHEMIAQASKPQVQAPRPVQNPTPPQTLSSSLPNPQIPTASLPTNQTQTDAPIDSLPASFFEEVRALLSELRISYPGVIMARAMTDLGNDLSSIPRARVNDFVRNVENEIDPRQAKLFRQSMTLTLDSIRNQPVKAVTIINNLSTAPKTPTNPTNPDTSASPTNGLRTVAATVLGRIPGPILSSLFLSEIRQTLEQLRVFSANTAIDRAAENLGFYPSEIPSSQTKKFLTAIISEITNEQGYQFQQQLDKTIKELESQGKTGKTAVIAERSSPFPSFTNPLAARAKPVAKTIDPALEFIQSLQQNLKSVVSANSVNGLIQAAASDLGIQASEIAPGVAQKFVQAISQRLDTETAQKFQRTMAIVVGVYTAQR